MSEGGATAPLPAPPPHAPFTAGQGGARFLV